MTARHTPDSPWDRQSGESRQAYAAFRGYVEAGPTRSAAKVAAECGKTPRLIERWSARWSWVARAGAYDEHTAAVFDDELVVRRREAAVRHARIAVAMQEKLAERIGALDVDELSPRDLAYWLDVTVKVERAALGVGERVELSGPEGGPIVLAALSDEERHARLLALRDEVDRRLEPVPS